MGTYHYLVCQKCKKGVFLGKNGGFQGKSEPLFSEAMEKFSEPHMSTLGDGHEMTIINDARDQDILDKYDLDHWEGQP